MTQRRKTTKDVAQGWKNNRDNNNIKMWLWTYIFYMHPYSMVRLDFYSEKLYFIKKIGVTTYIYFFKEKIK